MGLEAAKSVRVRDAGWNSGPTANRCLETPASSLDFQEGLTPAIFHQSLVTSL